MRNLDIIFTAVALSMDAFAVSICKGLSIHKITKKNCITIASYFSIFQMLMPFIGYTFATTFSSAIIAFDHWIAFILLFIIGANMIKDSFYSSNSEINEKTDIRTMLFLSIATSIDALVVGVTFSFLKVNLLFSILTIGVITFIITFIGVIIGSKFGLKYEKKATILGGVFLIFMGLRILFVHLVK